MVLAKVLSSFHKEVNGLTLFNDDFANLDNWIVAEGDWTVSNGILKGVEVDSAFRTLKLCHDLTLFH